MELWQSRWYRSLWCHYLSTGETESERIAIRRCTHSGRPLGDISFVEELELAIHRQLLPRKRGRRVKTISELDSQPLIFTE